MLRIKRESHLYVINYIHSVKTSSRLQFLSLKKYTINSSNKN